MEKHKCLQKKDQKGSLGNTGSAASLRYLRK